MVLKRGLALSKDAYNGGFKNCWFRPALLLVVCIAGDAKHPRPGFAGKHFDPDSHYLLSSSSTVFYIFPSCSCRPSKTVVKFENIRVAVFKRDWIFIYGAESRVMAVLLVAALCILINLLQGSWMDCLTCMWASKYPN